jgi:hypothetical protein
VPPVIKCPRKANARHFNSDIEIYRKLGSEIASQDLYPLNVPMDIKAFEDRPHEKT